MQFASSSYGQMPRSFNESTQYQSVSQLHAPNVSSEGQVTPLQHTGEQPSVTTSIAPVRSVFYSFKPTCHAHQSMPIS